MKKLILQLSLLTLFLVLTPNAKAADYRYSQFCLRGLRDQFSLDTHYPEYADNCADGTDFRGNINDPDLFQLAGHTYVKWESPTAINWEQQPLIKYFFGLIIVLGVNPLFAQYLFAIGIAVLIYYCAKHIFHLSPFIALVPLALFALDPLFHEQLRFTYLDLGLTFFVQLYLYLFWLWTQGKKRIVSAGIVLGLAALAKSFSIGIVLGAVSLSYLFFVNKKLIKNYLLSLWQPIAIYLLGYTMFFVYHGPADFVTLHIDILKFYKSYVPEYPKGEIFRLIFTGQWRIWWDDKGLIPSPSWSLAWPLALLASFATIFQKKLRQNSFVLLHLTWIVIYLLFSSLRLVFPRYLLPILSSLYFLTALIFARAGNLLSIPHLLQLKYDRANRSNRKGE